MIQNTTIPLFVTKGERTNLAFIKNDKFEFDWLNDSEWDKKRRNRLNYTVTKLGYYRAKEAGKIKYYEIYNESDELKFREIKKEDILRFFTLDIKQKEKIFNFNQFSAAAKNTGWSSDFKSIENTTIGENDNYIIISGTFEVTRKKYTRSFTCAEIYKPKKIILKDKIFSKKNDNIEIIFEDKTKIITYPVPARAKVFVNPIL